MDRSSLQIFAATNVLALLRLWLRIRPDRDLPDWDGAITSIPVELLSDLAITERRPHSVFRYVGSSALKRWGHGVTLTRVYEDTILGDHGSYLRSLGDDAVRLRTPVLSVVHYRIEGRLIAMGRIYAPFSYRDSNDARFIMGLQIPDDRDDTPDLRSVILETEVLRLQVADPAALVRLAQTVGLPQALVDSDVGAANAAIMPLRTWNRT